MAPLMLLPLVITILSCFLQVQGVDKYTDENRPYEFGFTIEGEQHRHEKKDERGLIMGEFGFITADGVYHVTVYATDENGNFRILSMKNIRTKPFPANERQGHSLPFPPVSQQPTAPPVTQRPYKPITIEPPRGSCSSCSLPTKKPPQLPPASVSFGGQQDRSQDPINYPQGGSDRYPSPGVPSINARFGENGQDFPNYSQGVEAQYNPQNRVSPNYKTEVQGPQHFPQGPEIPNYSQGVSAQGQQDYSQGQESPYYPQNQGAVENQQGQGSPNFQGQESPNYPQGVGQQGQQYYPQDQGSPNYQDQEPQNYPQLNAGQPNYALTGSQNFDSPGFSQDSENFPQSGAGTPRNFLNERNPKKYLPDNYNPNTNVIGGGQVSQKPQLISAQMQIVDRNTDIYSKNPGERDGLPDGLTKGDMTQLLYTFNYTVGFHGHHEKGYINGAKIGYYYVTGRDGSRVRVDYVADENGFRPKITREVLDLLSDEVPKPETERDERYGLKGYEFKWLYFPVESRVQ